MPRNPSDLGFFPLDFFPLGIYDLHQDVRPVESGDLDRSHGPRPEVVDQGLQCEGQGLARTWA